MAFSHLQSDACIVDRHTNFSTQQRTNVHAHPTDITHRSRSSTQQRNHGIPSRPQTPRQWQMAQVMSADHRRFLSNLFLNRELDRLSSFARWPTRRPNVPPSALAKTGFFYLGDLDRTQCFSCGGVLRNWTVNDNSLSEHRNHFADCPMVLGTENRNVPIPEQPESRKERERKFTCRYPSNPHMRSEATRLDTFDRRWPIGKTAATPEEIAQAGFFFLGERDRVKCWYCNGGLQHWDYDDAPWVEHAKWFPNCQFLLRSKGQHFVHRHLSAHPHLPRPIIAKQEGANLDVPATAQTSSARQQNPPMPGTGPSSNQPAATLTIIDPREEKRKRLEHIQNVMKNSDIVKSIIVMGFDAKILEGLLEEKLASGKQANNEDIYDSMSELLDDVMDRERQINEESTQAKMPSGSSNAAFAIGGTDKSSSSCERDRVKCWYCNGGLQNWDYDDAPWVEHAKWFPNCQFLLCAKGEHFVHPHLSAHPHLPRPIIAKQEGAKLDVPATGQASSVRQQNPPIPETGPSSSQPGATVTIIDPREEKRKRSEHIQSVMKNSDIVKSIIIMGFDQKIVEGLLEDKLASGKQANNEDIYDSMLELLNDVMDRERQIKEESTQAKIPSGASNVAGAIGGSANTSMPSSSPLLGAIGRNVDMKDPASLQNVMNQMKEDGLCKICHSNQANMVFQPCCHMCCCMECTQAIRQCLICRKQIDKAIKTYRS